MQTYGFDFWALGSYYGFYEIPVVGEVYYWTFDKIEGMREVQCLYVWDGTFSD